MKEFIINQFIKLRLENGKTNIYIKNKLFRQCKFLLINIQIKNLAKFEEVNSIDEAEAILDKSLEEKSTEEFGISPEEEFWAHCSNLDAWARFKYDTRLLYRNLAFPILKELTDAGDPVAKAVFKEEIISRFENGNSTVVNYLIREDYIEKYVKNELIEAFLENDMKTILKNLQFLSVAKLKIINMIDFYPKTIPQYSIVFKKRKILGLDFDCNDFKKLPLEITHIYTLEELSINNNNISLIPNEIQQLRNLRKLSLRGNFLKMLPHEISTLQSLEYLHLSVNNFKTFPECITDLKNLKYLNLGMNQISDIPESIKNLRNLRILALNNNEISRLSESITSLKSLELLYLDDNKLEMLPESFGKLTSLRELNVQTNKLRSLPESFYKLDKLEYLNLSRNNFKFTSELKEKLELKVFKIKY